MVHGAWLPRLNWTSGVIRLSSWRASLLRPRHDKNRRTDALWRFLFVGACG
jgi:hypothetical protein